jgi:hypothetical protein
MVGNLWYYKEYKHSGKLLPWWGYALCLTFVPPFLILYAIGWFVNGISFRPGSW